MMNASQCLVGAHPKGNLKVCKGGRNLLADTIFEH